MPKGRARTQKRITAAFVTGGTGFIGRFLVRELLARGAVVYLLVRPGSEEKLRRISQAWQGLPGRWHPLLGDLTLPGLLQDPGDRSLLAGKVRHFFHLAALYDLKALEEECHRVNVEGTKHALALARELPGVVFHHMSSIAVAGKYKGLFREDMYEAGQSFPHPYFSTKFLAEGLVRQSGIPFRIYRPGVVIGSSETGEADKLDGPYYFFKILQRLRNALPRWFPLPGIEGGKLYLVPVDFVAKATVAMAEQPGLEGKTFHLLDDQPLSLGEIARIFARAAHAPEFAFRLDTRVFQLIPPGVRSLLKNLPLLQELKRELAHALAVPEGILELLQWDTEFDNRNTREALRGTGIWLKPLEEYAFKIWDYWERYMDPELMHPRTLAEALQGKIVVITGASSGIGRATALRLSPYAEHLVLMARNQEKLEEVRAAIQAAGGRATSYPCDLRVHEETQRTIQEILAEHGRVDILINNAGHSIRRSLAESYERFHDFERLMNINYFGALRLILGFLPGMRERRFGHIINISSMGVQSNAPRFSGYVASKAALDAFSRCIAAEVIPDGVRITTIYMPLVKTPMIAPTRIYEFFPTLTPEEAADLVVRAILYQPKRISTRLGTFVEVAYALAPRLVDYIQSLGYRLFPPTAQGEAQPLSAEGVAFAHLMKGIHW